MNRRSALALTLALAMTALPPAPAAAQTPEPTEWRLIAIDGQPFTAEATLAFGADGAIAGRAPCNRWFGTNKATLPALDMSGIGATKMACDRLAEEDLFFAALALMTGSETTAAGTLVLRSADGSRVMEFAPAFPCTTCKP